MFKVVIQPSNIEFDVQDGETILQAALNNGIDFPFRCRQGVCTSCVCKTVEGEVHYGNVDEEQLLTETDKEQKFTYACIGYPKSDLILRHPFIK